MQHAFYFLSQGKLSHPQKGNFPHPLPSFLSLSLSTRFNIDFHKFSAARPFSSLAFPFSFLALPWLWAALQDEARLAKELARFPFFFFSFHLFSRSLWCSKVLWLLPSDHEIQGVSSFFSPFLFKGNNMKNTGKKQRLLAKWSDRNGKWYEIEWERNWE